MNEADTCRTYVVPMLQNAGWDNAPFSIAEQRVFSNERGAIRIIGGRVVRGRPKRADYLLHYRRDFPLAVVEAKANYLTPGTGLAQAKQYALMLDLKFAYSTNGTGIVEFDFLTGLETEMESFPTPEELWQRINAHSQIPSPEKILAPNYQDGTRPPRYYQNIAINRAVAEILKGRQRLLITMATGTGKTVVAFQICYKLWESHWNRTGDPVRRPKILFLADRNILVDEPKDKTFLPFGDARFKIEHGEVVQSREMYFAIYQALAEDATREGLYKQLPPDFFDLILVDECHRGSAREESTWREILTYFAPAVQLGMTATPLKSENKATYRYFGNPIYQYSLRQGLDDGFLAPYRVHRVVTTADAAGWRPTQGELDRLGREIPDDEYHTPDFERRLSLRPRSEAIARHLTQFLRSTNRHDKTIVFCVDQEHAEEMRLLLNNLNADLTQADPNYVCRVTSDEGDVGRTHLGRFQELESSSPVILTTSQLLTTGVDAPMVKNVVLIRMIGSISEFKQIIGRGTRLREDYQKFYFNIIDYTGTATRHFADSDFDGDPEFITEAQIDEEGTTVSIGVVDDESASATQTEDETSSANSESDSGNLEEDPVEYPTSPGIIVDPPEPVDPRKFYVVEGEVEIAAHSTRDLDAEGRQLRVTQFRDYTRDTVRSLFPDVATFRHGWSDPDRRAEVLAAFQERGLDPAVAAEELGSTDADPFDLLCGVAWDAPVMTRSERAQRLRSTQPEFFAAFTDSARQILEVILQKYAEHGPSEFSIPDSLQTPPLCDLGNPIEIAQRFGSPDSFHEAIHQLQEHLYAA